MVLTKSSLPEIPEKEVIKNTSNPSKSTSCCNLCSKLNARDQNKLRSKHIAFLKKCIAVACSQIGMAVFILFYLIIGCCLFRYLERENHQKNLISGVGDLNKNYADFVSRKTEIHRTRRSTSIVQAITIQCLDFQIQTVLNELNTINLDLLEFYPKSNITFELTGRIKKLENFRNEFKNNGMDTNMFAIQKKALLLMEVDLDHQLNVFNILLNKKSRDLSFSDNNDDKKSLLTLIHSVYNAYLSGWRPVLTDLDDRMLKDLTPRQFGVSSKPKLLEIGNSIISDPWTYSGSLFFSVTVITTIGYGQITPKTMFGRLFTIIYGLFGIPLMLLFLANLGRAMADILRITYRFTCICNKKLPDKLPQKLLEKTKNIQKIPKTITASPKQSISSTNDDKEDTIIKLNSVESQSSPPLRGTPGRNRKNQFGLHNLVKQTALPGITESLFISLAGQNSMFAKTMQIRRQSRSVRIPISLTLFIFFIYLLVGAYFFMKLENWSFVDASYFVFVTVSTIGFGDMIPGFDDTDYAIRTRKFFFATFYLLIGLAMVCMCFDLMQSEFKQKCALLAKRIGLLNSK